VAGGSFSEEKEGTPNTACPSCIISVGQNSGEKSTGEEGIKGQFFPDVFLGRWITETIGVHWGVGGAAGGVWADEKAT